MDDVQMRPRPSAVRISDAAGIIAIIIGALALFGWTRHLPVLIQIFPASPPMAPLTALAVIVAGLVLVGLGSTRTSGRLRLACRFGAGLVVLVGVLTLVEGLAGRSSDIGDALIRVVAGSAQPALALRPSALSGLEMMLVGGALLLLTTRAHAALSASQCLALVAWAIVLAYTYRYVYEASLLSGPPVVGLVAQIPVAGALAVSTLTVGIFAWWPTRGLLGVLASHGPARSLAHNLIVVSIAGPLVLSVLAMAGVDLRLYDVPTAIALATAGTTLVLALVALIVTREVDRFHLLLDAIQRTGDALATVSDDPGAVQQVIVAQARAVGAADYAALGLDGDAHHAFDPWVFTGVSAVQAAAISQFPRAVGLLGAVVQGGRAIRLGNLTRDRRFGGFPAHHPPMHAFLGTPIYFHGRPAGNLYLTRRAEEVSFSAADERTLGMFAVHAGAALEAVRLRALVAEERMRLQTLLDTIPIGIVFVEAETDRVFANTCATELFGRPFTTEGGRAQYAQHLLDPQGGAIHSESLPSSCALRGEMVERVDLLYVRPDGRRMPVRESAAPLHDAQGRLTGAVFVIEDVTAQKQLEQERAEWTSVITHDMRQPVAIIHGYAALLQQDLERAGTQGDNRRAAEYILSEARNLNRMIADLLDVSRIESRRLAIQLERTDLPALIREVLDRTQGVTAGHRVHLEVHGTVPPLTLDPARIEQVLGNLLSNAAKYSEETAPIELSVERQATTVEVTVRNVGPGIAPDELPRLFQRFYRTEEARAEGRPGIGLGLYIARGLVEAHGGRIWAESVPGQITTFRFTLPVPS
jgi:PAS domain S-box-containing protein